MVDFHDDLDLQINTKLREDEERRKKEQQARIRASVQARQEEAAAHTEENKLQAAKQDETNKALDEAKKKEKDETPIPNDETSVIGDIASALAGGISDAAINTAQLIPDIANAAEGLFGFDAIPDNFQVRDITPEFLQVDERESTLHNIVRGGTQFLTAFIPVFGVMGKLAKAKRVASAIKAGTLKEGKETLLHRLGREYTAGAIADSAAFSPHEERLSNLIENNDWTNDSLSNPITAYLASDEDDSALEGRLKNILEGGAMGILFDSIFRGARGLWRMKNAEAKSYVADVDVTTVQKTSDTHQQAGVLRQRVEELDAVAEELRSKRQGAVDPAVEEARLGGDNLSPEAEAIRIRADSLGQSMDEYADEVSDFGKYRAEDPEGAAAAVKAGDLAEQRISEERFILMKEVVESETELFNLRNSAEFKSLPKSVRDEWNKLDDAMPPSASDEIRQIHSDLADNAARAGDTKIDVLNDARLAADEAAGKTTEPLTSGVRDADGNVEFDIFDVDADGVKTLNMEKFAAAERASNPLKPDDVVPAGKPITTISPELTSGVAHVITKGIDEGVIIPRLGKGAFGRTFIDRESIRQLTGMLTTHNVNLNHIGGKDFELLQASELAELIKTNLGSSFTSRTLDEKRALALGSAEAMAKDMGNAGKGEEVLNNFLKKVGGNAEDLAIDLTVLRILNESARESAILIAKEARLTDKVGMPTMTRFLNSIVTAIRTQETLSGVTSEIAGALGAFRINVEALPSFVTEMSMMKDSLGSYKAYQAAIESAGGKEQILNMMQEAEVLFRTSEGFHNYAGGIGKEASWWGVFLETWMGIGLLSGLPTHIVNVTSNTTVSLISHIEEFGVGLARMAFHGEDIGLRKAVGRVGGAMDGFKRLLSVTDDPDGLIRQAVAARLTGSANVDQLVKDAMDQFAGKMNPLTETFITGVDPTVRGGQKFELGMGRKQQVSSASLRELIPGLDLGSEVGMLAPGTTTARFADVIGSITNMSFRGLAVEDTIAKTIAYGSARKGNIIDYVMTVEKRRGADATKRIDEMAKGIDNRKALLESKEITKKTWSLYEEMHNKNVTEARRYSWTEDLTEGSISGDWYRATQDHPVFKLFTPFVRTSVNLFKWGSTRTPLLNRATAEYKELGKRIAKGKKLGKPDVLAKREMEAFHVRSVMATAALTTAAALAYDGIITGVGPTDPGERRAILATGWKPNSIRFQQDDGSYDYHSFDRAEPMGMFLSMVATFGETAGHVDGIELEEIGFQLGFSVIESMRSKTYLAGITSVINALSRPEQNLENWWQQLASSAAPALLTGLNRTGVIAGHLFPGLEADPMMREVNSVMDAFRAKLPGFSKDLPPKRNWFGEAITWSPFLGANTISPFHTPYATSNSPSTLVNNEIQRLVIDHGFSVSMNGFDTIEGTRLDPHTRDRFIQLSTGDPSRNGSNIRKALDSLMRSSRYKNADDSRDGKQRLIKELMAKRTDRGRRALRKENQELDAQLQDAKKQRSQARRSKARRDLAQKNSSQSGNLLASLTQTPDKLS
jgi:hypothetical protein